MNRRKELQNEYGMKQRSMGVFEIVNEKNGKRYIASSPTLDSAWQREKFMLDTGSHINSTLQKEYKEQAGAQFEFQVLEKLKLGEEVRNDYKDILGTGSTALNRLVVQSYRDQLRKLEQRWLDELKPYEPNGFNRPPKQQ